MAILIDRDTTVLVHNATSAYAAGMIDGMRRAGTRVVGGVVPGRRGDVHEDTPLFDTVAEAVAATGANTSVLYVPASGVADAIVENVDAGIKLIVVIAEYVPLQDAVRALGYARERGVWVIGPNCIGMIAPGVGMLSAIPPDLASPGPVGLMSRSGTAAGTTLRIFRNRGIGQSAIISMGGDAVVGRNPVEYARLFDADPQTKIIALVCEIGGMREYDLAEAVPSLSKPLVVLVLGRHAPRERRMGHAGALANSDLETAEAKRRAFAAAGAHVADDPYHMADIIRGLLGQDATRATA